MVQRPGDAIDLGPGGDFSMLYLLTGIFAYLTHIQAVREVMGAERPDLGDDAACPP